MRKKGVLLVILLLAAFLFLSCVTTTKQISPVKPENVEIGMGEETKSIAFAKITSSMSTQQLIGKRLRGIPCILPTGYVYWRDINVENFGDIFNEVLSQLNYNLLEESQNMF